MSELAELFAYVDETVRSETDTVQVRFGKDELAQQINRGATGRIVFHEGAPDGDIGEEVPPWWPGSHPRPLKDELELFTVYIWGYNTLFPKDSLKQHDAAWGLFCAWRRIVFLKAQGRVALKSKRWKSPNRIVRPFGKEIEVICSIRSQVLDTPMATVEGVASETTIRGLGETEVVTTSGTGAQ